LKRTPIALGRCCIRHLWPKRNDAALPHIRGLAQTFSNHHERKDRSLTIDSLLGRRQAERQTEKDMPMSSVSGVAASVVTPQVTPTPASQNSAPQNPPASSDKAAAATKADAVQPTKPPGQGQVVYIST
jgi:hypothetical protein